MKRNKSKNSKSNVNTNCASDIAPEPNGSGIRSDSENSRSRLSKKSKP